MSWSTHAILKHPCTAEHPKRNDCREGEKSWSGYQPAIALGTNNHKCLKNPLPPAVVECIQSVFDQSGRL